MNLEKVVLIVALVICKSARVPAITFDCGKALQINKTNPSISFSQPYSGNNLCKWELLGDRGCEVELSCTVDIPGDGLDCEDNHLLITDAYEASQKYCGEKELVSIRPSEGLRDLFVVLSTSEEQEDKVYKGISCTVKVVDNPAEEEGRLVKNWEGKKENRCVCGTKSKGDRIVGGEDAEMFEFPWLAAIVDKGTRKPFCGAALINDKFVLTAAHCFVMSGKKAEDIEVLLHAHVLDQHKAKGWKDVELGMEGSIRSPGWDLDRRTDEDEKTQRFGVAEVINHPLFTRKYDFDFALLRLNKKIDLSDSDAPTPICLPPATTFDSFNLEGKDLIVSGWGMANEKAKASTRMLQKLVVPYMTRAVCNKFLSKYLTDRMICFGFDDGVKDACSGDSGGPLIHQLPNDQWWQMGVVSWGIGCARAKKPGVYSQVTEGAQWIHFHAAHHEAKWCRLNNIQGRTLVTG